MSNVLIGIIGVILFIGLALAGALILGDDFKASRSSSNAAAVAGQLQQIQSAVQMRQLKMGAPLPAADSYGAVSTLVPRFLKVAPINTYNGQGYSVNDANGGTSGGVGIVKVYLGTGADAYARSVCAAIEEQAGNAGAVPSSTDFSGTIRNRGTVGCFLYSPQDSYYAYVST
jgi:hypothetical protein